MKKLNKKGFTIVELVIVIAVIAILAGVMIPTFGGVINNANKSAALQKANNAYKAYIMETNADTSDLVISVDGKYWFTVTGNKLEDEPAASEPAHHATAYPLVENSEGIVLYVAGSCPAPGATATTCDKCGASIPAVTPPVTP